MRAILGYVLTWEGPVLGFGFKLHIYISLCSEDVDIITRGVESFVA